MRILVTGGAGFIASNVADAYVQAGHEVAVVDNLSSGFRENINPKARFYEQDIADPKVLDIFADFKPEVLNHHAAQISVPLSVDDPRGDARVNVMGWLNLLEGCRAHGIKRVLYVSSGGVVYGDPEQLPADETFPIRPESPYGIAKATGEHYLHFYSRQADFTYVTFRYGNVYGPRQVPHGEAGVVSIFIQSLMAGKAPTIFGDGSCIRDYVFVGDVVRANVLALGKGENVAVNIGTGIPTDVNQVYQAVQAAMKNQTPALSGPARRGDLKAIYLNASLAEKILGWKPEVRFMDGVKKTYEYFRDKAKGV
ncbi:NAD-dependent epimerase/dehydratase family protein [candidate division FCPU426 bacterium]|nr:NAD-dependent epimerase/dehydratase family protein [candidate division FCPU426 bacterium]